MSMPETHNVGTNLNQWCSDLASLTGERASRCSEAIEAVALFFPHLSQETVAASLCTCLRATDAESGALVRHFWQEVERLHFIQPLRAASNEGRMVHLVIDLTASDLDEVAARLETITEAVAQGCQGAGYCITGDIELEGNAAFWEDEEEDNESAAFDFDTLLMQDEDDSPPKLLTSGVATEQGNGSETHSEKESD